MRVSQEHNDIFARKLSQRNPERKESTISNQTISIVKETIKLIGCAQTFTKHHVFYCVYEHRKSYFILAQIRTNTHSHTNI